MITKNHRQEVISRAYVHAIAARSGFVCGSTLLDYGIDLSIHDVVKLNGGYGESGYKIDVQLKSCTGTAFTLTHVRYDLDVDAYNALVMPTGNPRILVLLVLPDDEQEWTVQTEASLEIRRCAYWICLEGMPASTNKRVVRVSIPRANVFSIEQLNRLMQRVRRREKL